MNYLNLEIPELEKRIQEAAQCSERADRELYMNDDLKALRERLRALKEQKQNDEEDW